MRKRGIPFVRETERKQRRLLRLYELAPDEQIKSKVFQVQIKRAKTIAAWWKRKYGYSANDPRLLSATFTQMLTDAVEDRAFDYIQEFEGFDTETNEFLKRRILDPQADEKEAERLAEQLNKAMKAGRK